METFFAIQRWVRDAIALDLQAFADERSWLALIAVLPLGVFLGALHALTPGHSKTVLATYVAGSTATVARGLAVAATLAVTHVFSAVAIALLALPLMSHSLGQGADSPLLADLSRGLLAAIGLWMVWRAWRHPVHGHAEGPAVGVIAGLIPCPLTLFVMTYAMVREIPEAGLVFALAMMLGILTTLGGVAALSVLAREALSRLIESRGKSLARASRLFEGLAGVILIAIGLRELLS